MFPQTYNHRFQKVFKEFKITQAVDNKFNTKANHKEKEPSNRKSGIYCINCQDCPYGMYSTDKKKY